MIMELMSNAFCFWKLFIALGIFVLKVGWLVVLGLTALLDSISVYIGSSPGERGEKK